MAQAAGRPHDFSRHTAPYHAYRPGYPQALFRYLASVVADHALAWDCATGSGQAASGLSPFFHTIMATDVSAGQLANAFHVPNIRHAVTTAERAGIKTDTVDLIVAAQALHWFDRDVFFTEARRVLKPRGLIAVWSYNLLSVTPAIDAVVQRLYTEIIADYWPPQRRLVENGYAGLDFPFRELAAPAFEMRADWSLTRLIGYLRTWSAVQRYQDAQDADPVERIYQALERAWGKPASRRVAWPLSLRIGRP